MGVRKICKAKGCKSGPRCDHEWWFDLMHKGQRVRMPVNVYALTRGALEPVTSKQTADRVWWPKFLADVVAGRDPRIGSRTAPATVPTTVADLLHRYYTEHIEPERLRSWATVRSRLKGIVSVISSEPAVALERQETILRFKGVFTAGLK